MYLENTEGCSKAWKNLTPSMDTLNLKCLQLFHCRDFLKIFSVTNSCKQFHTGIPCKGILYPKAEVLS